MYSLLMPRTERRNAVGEGLSLTLEVGSGFRGREPIPE